MTRQADNDEHKPLLKKIRNVLKDRIETVNVSQRLVDSPACVVSGSDDLSPQVRRMLEASGQSVPASKPVLEINVTHPLVERLSHEADEERFLRASELRGARCDTGVQKEGEKGCDYEGEQSVEKAAGKVTARRLRLFCSQGKLFDCEKEPDGKRQCGEDPHRAVGQPSIAAGLRLDVEQPGEIKMG